MDKFYKTIILFLFPLLSSSQNFVERSMAPIFNSSLSQVESDNSGNFYLGGSSSWGMGITMEFLKIDKNGNIIFEVPLIVGEISELTDIDRSQDLNFLLCGSGRACDFSPSETGFVMKCDSIGNVQWLKQIYPETQNGPVDNNFKGLTELSNRNMVVHSDSTLIYLSENGDSLWSMIIPDGINELSSNDDNILISSDSNLIIIDTLGSTVNQISFNGMISFIELLTDSTYLIVVGSNLVVLDNSLTVMHSFDLFANNIDASLIGFDPSRICVGNSSGSEFACFDHTLTLLDTFQIQAGDVFCSSLAVKDTTIYLFGGEAAFKNNQYVKSISVTGNYIYHDVDLEITDVSFTDAYAYNTPPLPAEVFVIDFFPTVTVRNNGTEEINSFNLNNIAMLGGFCGPLNRTQHFNNLSLAPGDTMTITMNMITEFGIVINQPYNFTYHFCPWVSCPDSVTDKNHSNDQLCDSFLIDEIVLVEEITEEKIRLYPNPAGDKLHVVLPDGILNGEYSILNSLGEIVQTGKISNGEIPTLKLRKGFYFLKIDNRRGGMISKFIKADFQ